MPQLPRAEEECLLDKELGPWQDAQIQILSWGTEHRLSIATLNIQHALNHFDYLREILERKVAHVLFLQEHGVNPESRHRFSEATRSMGYTTHWAPDIGGPSQLAVISSIDVTRSEWAPPEIPCVPSRQTKKKCWGRLMALEIGFPNSGS